MQETTTEEAKASSFTISEPVLLAVASVEPYEKDDQYTVTFKTVVPKHLASSILYVSRKHLIVGELKLTEGDL